MRDITYAHAFQGEKCELKQEKEIGMYASHFDEELCDHYGSQ